MRDHYWDLNECRWVRYVPNEGQEAVPVPAQRTQELATEPAPSLATS